MKKILFFAISITGVFQLHAQSIKGIIKDAQTAQPIPGASITTPDHRIIIANDDGVFILDTTHIQTIHISSVGYSEKDIPVKTKSGTILILLEPSNYSLNEVQVTGWSVNKNDNQLTQAQSVGVLTRKDLLRTNNLFLENSLNLIPGVAMQSRSLSGGQRIIIRGYGNNTNFNGQGYQVYLNNIPITDATGTTIMDDIDFSTLGKVEVFKGPESSLYGSGIAGVVNLYTLKPEPNQTRLVQENVIGSYGLWRNNTRVEAASSNASIVFNYGHQAYDGFREHSASRKDFASFNGDFFVGDKQTISTYFSYNHSYEELAGEIDSTKLYGRKKYSDPAYLVNNSNVAVESFRMGVTDNFSISKHFSNQTTVFSTGYNLNQPFAHGLSSNQVHTFGGRTGFVYEGGIANANVHGILGAQFEKTNAFNKSYNLTNDTLGGIRGDLQNNSSAYNLFTEWKVSFPNQFIVTAGGSLNFLEYSIQDLLANSANPTHADQSGYKRFKPVFTPRIAVLKTLNNNVSLYADVSAGYTPPATSNVIITATGQTNYNLKSESGVQYEVGTKGSMLNKKLSYQLALFYLNVTNKLIATTIAATGNMPQYTMYVNAGKQQNIGGELSINYAVIRNTTSAVTLLRPFVTYTYSDFKYKNFSKYDNNKVAGVAPNRFNAGIDLETKPGLYAYATYQFVDKVPYTFDNIHYAKSYQLLGGKIGYRHALGKHFSVDAFAGADNLLNKTYYSFLFLSPSLAPGEDPHFLPGSYHATVYGGAHLAYRF